MTKKNIKLLLQCLPRAHQSICSFLPFYLEINTKAQLNVPGNKTNISFNIVVRISIYRLTFNLLYILSMLAGPRWSTTHSIRWATPGGHRHRSPKSSSISSRTYKEPGTLSGDWRGAILSLAAHATRARHLSLTMRRQKRGPRSFHGFSFPPHSNSRFGQLLIVVCKPQPTIYSELSHLRTFL